jgi:subtilisin family serine protease
MRLQVLLALLPAVLAAPSSPAKREDGPAPLYVPDAGEALIANKYIVKLKDGASVAAVQGNLKLAKSANDHVYSEVFNGFTATLDATTLSVLRDQPDVDYVEQDATVSLKAFVTQNGATWGLGKLSKRIGGSTSYTYDDSAGNGTCVYVLDTGVEASHPEFQGRAKQIKTFITGDNTDGNGHGTHVAGTIGSKTYGVAKKTKIFGVKILDDSGSGAWSGIIAAMDFVVKDKANRVCPKGVMVNMSVGGSKVQSVNDALANMINNGNVFAAVAAGNESDDTQYYSPGSTPVACTVGAISKGPTIAYYSNYGPLVDVFAPGTDVKSTWIFGSTNTISGTSMATPHVAGLAAYLSSLQGYPGANALCTKIKNLATPNIITGLPSGTPNRLAFNGNPSG